MGKGPLGDRYIRLPRFNPSRLTASEGGPYSG